MPDAPVDPAEFRGLMARWATGVTVVTAHHAGHDAGLTVNAFLSVSLRPPSVLVSLMHDVDSLPVIEASGAFAVNVLASDQRSWSERFARTVPSEEKFRDVTVHRGSDRIPLLDGTLGALVCRRVAAVPQFDHVLLVGEVVRQETGRDAAPLLFFRSSYAESDGEGRFRLPPSGRR